MIHIIKDMSNELSVYLNIESSLDLFFFIDVILLYKIYVIKDMMFSYL